MTNTVDALILDLLEWIGPKPRAYAEVIAFYRRLGYAQDEVVSLGKRLIHDQPPSPSI